MRKWQIESLRSKTLGASFNEPNSIQDSGNELLVHRYYFLRMLCDRNFEILILNIATIVAQVRAAMCEFLKLLWLANKEIGTLKQNVIKQEK